MSYPLRKTDEHVLITEGAIVVGNVTLGKGVSIWYNAVLRGDQAPIVIGEDTNIQECVVIHNATVIGAGCTVGHGAVVHGCTVGDNTLIGMSATVLTGARIGRDCIVGGGAVVTGKMDVPDGSLVLGNPGKVVRSLTEAEIESIRASRDEYLEMTQWYRQGFLPQPEGEKED